MALSCISVMGSNTLTIASSTTSSSPLAPYQILRHEFVTVNNSFSSSYPLANTNGLTLDYTGVNCLSLTNSIPSSVSINAESTGITIMVRVRQSSNSYTGYIFYNLVNSKNGGGDQSGFFRISLSQDTATNGNFHFTYSSINDNMQQHLYCVQPLPASQVPYNHCAVTLVPSNNNQTITASYYLNGSPITSTVKVSTYTSSNTSNWANLCNMASIGLLNGAHTGSGVLKGVLRDFRIYSKALSPSEITQVYNNTLV